MLKLTFFFFSLLVISCSTKEKEKAVYNQAQIISQKTIKAGLNFKEIQDSLRVSILHSKPNENLKSNKVLQELYVRELVNQVENKIKFNLPFNLHGFDCGAPDCYSTDISFEFIAKNPIEFPKTINFKLLEYGCGIESEISKNDIFELVEESSKYVNYYSKKQKSNLVILGEKRKLYYFTNATPNLIKIELKDKVMDDYNDENENSIVPYQSTTMTTYEYENFIK